MGSEEVILCTKMNTRTVEAKNHGMYGAEGAEAIKNSMRCICNTNTF